MTQNCLNCSNPIDSDAVFCSVCGSPAIKVFSCPNCQNPVTPEAKFCKHCACNLTEFNPFQSIGAEENQENPASLISPSGAAFAIICFFLPWMQSCDKSLTGAELATNWTSLWLIPITGVTAFAAYFIFKFQKKLYQARPFIIGSSIIALGVLIFASRWGIVAFFSGEFEVLSLLKYGSYGTVIGFILAIAGCLFITRAVIKNKVDESEN
jgi:hypothetical protein